MGLHKKLRIIVGWMEVRMQPTARGAQFLSITDIFHPSRILQPPVGRKSNKTGRSFMFWYKSVNLYNVGLLKLTILSGV